MDLEHEKRLADVENMAKSNKHRLDRLEESTRALNRLATAVEVMATKQDGMSESIERLNGKVDAIEAQDGKKWRFVVEKTIYIVVAAVLGYALAQIGLN